MVDEQYQRTPWRRGKAQTRRGPLGKERARLGMRTRAHCAPGVVQEKRKIKDKWVLESFEQPPVGTEFRVLRLHHLVELVDANQGVFVGGVAMEEFVLHQAGELPEFGNVPAEEIHPVHHAQHPADLALPRNDPLENLPWALAAAERARDQPQISREQIRQVRTQLEPAELGQLEDLHHRFRRLFENIGALGEKLALPNPEMAELLLRRFQPRQKTEKRAGSRG